MLYGEHYSYKYFDQIEETNDPINPNHYKLSGGIESFDFQQAVCERLPGREASLVFNILKYVTRYKLKNGAEDLKKAKWYLEALIKEVEDV